MMEIVEEPAVQACGPQFLLYGFDWRHNDHPTTRKGGACRGPRFTRKAGQCRAPRLTTPAHATSFLARMLALKRRALGPSFYRPGTRKSAVYWRVALEREKSRRGTISSHFRKRRDGANLFRSGPLNFHALEPAPLARRDFNSGQRHIQMSGEKASQGFVGAALHGRNMQANAQSALPFAVDLIAARPRLNANQETQSARALPDFDHFVCRVPKSAVPRRICVAPSSMAISKSRAPPCSFANGRQDARWPPGLRQRAPSTPIPEPGFRRNAGRPVQRLHGFVPRGRSWRCPRWLRRKLFVQHARQRGRRVPEWPRRSRLRCCARFPCRGF